MSVDLHGLLHALGERERAVLAHILRRTPATKDPNVAFDASLTLGERLADRVASFGGSWSFIVLFVFAMTVWMLANVERAAVFDPYPFILLNLVLSCLAALQAPIIMMSQNRQAARDRLDAQHDYEVNLKAEMEIMALHLKLDELRSEQWAALMKAQAEQLGLLQRLVGEASARAPVE